MKLIKTKIYLLVKLIMPRTVRVEIRRDPSSIIKNSVNPVVQQNRLYSRRFNFDSMI